MEHGRGAAHDRGSGPARDGKRLGRPEDVVSGPAEAVLPVLPAYRALLAGLGQVDRRGVTGTLRLGGETIALERVSALYTRMMDDRKLPETGTKL